MGNIHFTEIFDFFVGWSGYDVSGDDRATRIAEEERALKILHGDRPKEPAKLLPEGPPEEPSEEPPKKPPEEPPRKEPPKEPSKEPRRKPTERDLRDIIP